MNCSPPQVSRFLVGLLGLAILFAGVADAQTSDEFGAPALGAFWTVENPSSPASFLSLTDRPGFLRVSSTHQSGGGDYCGCSNFNAPRLFQPTSGGWVLETMFEFSPSDNYEGAGIFVPGPTSTTGQRIAERAFFPDGGGQVVRCVGGYVPYSGTTTYFRLVQSGGTLTGYWSPDGVTWNLSGSTAGVLSSVGLFVVRRDWEGDTPRPAVADFDYFRFTGDPTPIRDATWGRVKALYR